jgi:hypothetical protein
MTEVSNEYEEIIFDYLEGNLSNNEREAFEMLLASNEDLRSQVMDWRQTYITESFSPTTELTERILKSTRKTHWTFSLNSFICAALFCLLVPVDINEQIKLSISERSTTQIVHVVKPHTSAKKTDLTTAQTAKKNQIDHPNAEINKNDNTMLLSENIIFKKPDTYALVETAQLSLRETEFVMKPVKHIPQPGVRLLSSKSIRMINRKKHREYDRRLEKKFQSGNVPYVVPLDINNF